MGDEALLDVTTSAPAATGAPAPAGATGAAPGAATGATGTPSPAAGGGAGASGFTIAVRSRTGVPRPGVPASVSGPAGAAIVSGPDGVLRFSGPPGRYEVLVSPGCAGAVHVQTGATARIAVPEGETVDGRLTVESRRRWFPGGPVRWQARRPDAETERSGRQWRVGTPYIVRYTVIDRCSEQAAPGAVVGPLAFPSPFPLEVQVQDAPAGPDATAVVSVTCRDVGEEVELVVADPSQPDDRVDLFSRALLEDTAPNCVR